MLSSDIPIPNELDDNISEELRSLIEGEHRAYVIEDLRASFEAFDLGKP